MKKDITVNVIGGILLTILIALSITWIKSQKNELVSELTSIIDKNTKEINEELKKERSSRAELAATLFKSGIDMPTKLLMSFSSIGTDDQAKKIFIKTIVKRPNFIEDKNKLLKKILSSNLETTTAYTSKLNNDTLMVMISGNPDISLSGIKGNFSIKNASIAGEIKPKSHSTVTVGSVEISDFAKILDTDNVKTSDVFIINNVEIK